MPQGRPDMKIATWNVRSLFAANRLQLVIQDFDEQNLDLLAIQETFWPDKGEFQTGDKYVYFSGAPIEEDPRHRAGVGFILNRRTQAAVLDSSLVSPRICTITLKTWPNNLKIINVYAPDSSYPENDYQDFLEALHFQTTIPPHNYIILGDLNAKVGPRSAHPGINTQLLGPYNFPNVDTRGELLLDFCTTNQLSIVNTFFKHKKKINQATYVHHQGLLDVPPTYHVIDYFLCPVRLKSFFNNVSSTANTDHHSDHLLLQAKIKLRQGRWKTRETSPRRQVDLLQHGETRLDYQTMLTTTLTSQPLVPSPGEDSNSPSPRRKIQQQWQQIDQAFRTARTVLPNKTGPLKRPLNPETWDKIHERKRLRLEMMTQGKRELQPRIQQLKREIDQRLRAEKEEKIAAIAEQAKIAADKGDSHELYKNIKSLSYQHKPSTSTVLSPGGTPVTGRDQQLNTVQAYFNHLLNPPDPENPLQDIAPAENDLNIDLDPITIPEIKRAIKRLKDRKAAGPDKITPEELKALPESMYDEFQRLFNRIWKRETTPSDWGLRNIITLPKKGDPRNLSNKRGISLLSIPMKVFAFIILNRMLTACNAILNPLQAGFRPGFSCADNIFLLRQLIQQHLQYGLPLHMHITFIDFAKAFDTVHRQTLFKILRHYGIPKKLVNIISDLYDNDQGRVKHGQATTGIFDINTGVRQGCLLSPLLFIILLDYVMRQVNIHTSQANPDQQPGTNILHDLRIEHAAFADDAGLINEYFGTAQYHRTKKNAILLKDVKCQMPPTTTIAIRRKSRT